MTIKLNSLSRWARFPNGKRLVLPGIGDDAERRVRLNVNCEVETSLFIGWPDGEVRLLAVVPAGLETVEFSTAGEISIQTDAGEREVWVQTAELEATHFEVHNPVIFTELAQRRHRNPELEEMMFRMQLNVERRLAQQAEEHAAQLARISRIADDARPAEQPAKPSGKADEPRSAKVRAQKPAAAAPGPQAGSEDGGEQPGDDGDGTPGSV